MKLHWLWALLAASALACGGRSTTDGAAGSGGSTGGSGGAVGGSGGSTGGMGGVECDAALKSSATLGGPQVGFGSLPSGPGGALIVAVLPDRLSLNLGPGGGTFDFKWVGPDLTQKFQQGEMVEIGNSDGWDFVAGGLYTAATYHQYGFVAPQEIPKIPYYGPHLSYATQCTFVEQAGACGQSAASVSVLALEVTTGAGVLTIPHGATSEMVGFEITNVNNVQFPGYSDETCVLEAGFVGIITAIGPSLDY